MMRVLPRLRLLFVMLCCASWSAEPLLAQTSPKGTFKIETVEKPAEDPTADPYEQQYVVSTADPKVREPLGKPRQAHPAEYFISPDERWIFATYHLGSRMGGAELFKRGEGLKFHDLNPSQSFAEMAWRYFADNEKIDSAKVPFFQNGVGITDFVAWSPDSARLLVALRGDDFDENDPRRGIYLWYLYFNTRSGELELTDYLRRLDKDAWKRFRDEKLRANFGEAASAEPLDELPTEAESRKRYEVADRRVKELFQKLIDIDEKQLRQSIHDEQTSQTQREIYQEQLKSSRDLQRTWIKTREIGAKVYADSGNKSTAPRRYWQYMADRAEAQANALKQQIEIEER
jgi:hypothetical protein